MDPLVTLLLCGLFAAAAVLKLVHVETPASGVCGDSPTRTDETGARN